jgi:hypothetical protein
MSNLPATFEQRVRERINDSIADLIPSSELEELIKSQVSKFRQADLPEMIRAEIRTQFATAIKAEFTKAEYAPTWAQHGGMAGSEAVRKIGSPE